MKSRVKTSLILLLIGMAVNIALAIIKLYVGLSTNSLTIMLDAINSFFDIITCVITAVAMAILLRPRGENSPHGYGRSEYLASFVVAAVSVIVGALFFIRSLNRMAMPEPVWFGVESCVLIALAVPLKLGIGLMYLYANKKIKSKALSALALDSFLDTGITSASLVCFLISSRVDYAVDAIFGMVLSVIIIVFAVKMVWDSVKSVVVGDVDDCKETVKNSAAAAIAKLGDELGGAELVGVDIHDYGFGEKIASVRVLFKKDVLASDVSRLKDEISFGAEDVSVDLIPQYRSQK